MCKIVCSISVINGIGGGFSLPFIHMKDSGEQIQVGTYVGITEVVHLLGQPES